MNKKTTLIESVKDKILTIRNSQVMLDRDLASLYGVETRVLKQAVNRNLARFPDDFMFVLIKDEIDELVSQNVIPSKKYLGGALPFVFTEQGIANLSSVLSNDRAIKVNIQIMRAFVAMRKFVSRNVEFFHRLDSIEQRQLVYQIKTDEKIEKLFEAIDRKDIQPSKGIFYDGQIFDAYSFVSKLIKSAKKSILLVDSYVDESVLTLFSKRNKEVDIVIYTKLNKQLELDIKKFSFQYGKINVKDFSKSHDRFMIVDEKEVYHFGASLKDLGKKWFAFSKFDKKAVEMLDKLK